MKKPTTPDDDRNHEPATSDPNAAMITERETEREGVIVIVIIIIMNILVL